MENTEQIRRICKFCKIEFFLTESQKTQAKEKWATHCSRSCARKAQHAKNHGNKRISKKCEICKKEFIVVNWDKYKKFCSNKCSSTARFGHIKRDQSRLNQILKDEKYLGYIENVARKIQYKWGLGEWFYEDLLQEYFLELSKGNNTTIENVSKSLLRIELKKGVTGKWDVDFTFSTMDAIPYIKENYKKCSTTEFIKYIKEVFLTMDDVDKKFLWLWLKGFTDLETKKEIRKIMPISNQNYEDKKKQIKKDLWYKTYGENYKSIKDY